MVHRPTAICTALILILTLAVPLYAADGAGLYKAKCALCHGQSGDGDTPMGKKFALRALGSPEVQKQTDAVLTEVVQKGKGKSMPAFAGKLTDAEMKAVVAFVRTLAKK